MKRHTLLFLLVLFFLMLTLLHGANAQKRYVVKVKLVTGQVTKGELLYASGDSLGLLGKQFGNRQLKLSEVSSIKIRRKGSIGRGMAYGAGTGAVIGALIGVASYTPPQCPPGSWFCIDMGPEAEAAGGAILGMAVGSLVGAMAGSGSTEIKINADPGKFDAFKIQYGLGVSSSAIKRY